MMTMIMTEKPTDERCYFVAAPAPKDIGAYDI